VPAQRRPALLIITALRTPAHYSATAAPPCPAYSRASHPCTPQYHGNADLSWQLDYDSAKVHLRSLVGLHHLTLRTIGGDRGFFAGALPTDAVT
jgi:hypothetical protein